jgi:hypothetical protein
MSSEIFQKSNDELRHWIYQIIEIPFSDFHFIGFDRQIDYFLISKCSAATVQRTLAATGLLGGAY